MEVFEGRDLNFSAVHKQLYSSYPQSPYSSDLIPGDFFFLSLSPFKGRRFDTIEELKQVSLEELQRISPGTFCSDLVHTFLRRCIFLQHSLIVHLYSSLQNKFTRNQDH